MVFSRNLRNFVAMKEFLKVLARFLPSYKKNVVLNVVFNLLAAFLTLFSFALIIPILEMLFQINQTDYVLMQWSDASFKTVLVNNFYYYTQ